MSSLDIILPRFYSVIKRHNLTWYNYTANLGIVNVFSRKTLFFIPWNYAKKKAPLKGSLYQMVISS